LCVASLDDIDLDDAVVRLIYNLLDRDANEVGWPDDSQCGEKSTASHSRMLTTFSGSL
jgi:hypothetical protein